MSEMANSIQPQEREEQQPMQAQHVLDNAAMHSALVQCDALNTTQRHLDISNKSQGSAHRCATRSPAAVANLCTTLATSWLHLGNY
jgi:hypothetical protein